MGPHTRLFLRRLSFSLLLLLLSLALPAAAEADDSTRFVLRQRVVALLNPMGAQHYLELGSRTRIGDQDSLWFTGAHLETGVLTAVSPVFATGGGYLQLSPLSFLVLRAQLTGECIWPLDMDGAGYYGFEEYDPHVVPKELGANAAGSASGYRARFSGTLQGMVPMGRSRLLFLNQFGGERASVGDEPYYYDVQNDIVRAQTDWLLTNDAFVGVDLVVGEGTIIRFGVFDSLRFLPASGQANNQVGPLVMLIFDRPGKLLSAVEPFVRAAFYTHHGSRQDTATILGGLSLHYDLGGV